MRFFVTEMMRIKDKMIGERGMKVRAESRTKIAGKLQGIRRNKAGNEM